MIEIIKYYILNRIGHYIIKYNFKYISYLFINLYKKYYVINKIN